MASSNKAAQKFPIMNYEQLLISVFSCFHGQNLIKKKKLHCSVLTKKLLNKTELPQVGIFFALNFLPWEFLLIKKLEIQKNKTTQYTTFKTDTYIKSGQHFFL